MRAGAADLRLADAEQGFFLAEINFDVPAVKVSFDDALGVEVLVGAEEKGGTAIEQLGTLTQAISQGSNNDELQNLMGSGGAPHESGPSFEAQLMRGAVIGEGEGLPGRIVGADLFGRRSGRPITEVAAAPFLLGGIGPEQQPGILAEAANGGGVRGKVAENGLVGVATVEGDEEPARGRGGIGVEVGAQIADLFAGALAEAGGENLRTIFLQFSGRGLFRRFGGSGSMAEGDGQHPVGAVGSGEGERSLEEALGAHEIGLEARAQGIAAPQSAPGQMLAPTIRCAS